MTTTPDKLLEAASFTTSNEAPWNRPSQPVAMEDSLRAENERLVKLVSAAPPAVVEPEIEALLLRLETPTREDVANGTTVVYTPKPDVLWVCAAYRRLRAASQPVDDGWKKPDKLLREALIDLLAYVDGDISGPAQRDGIISEPDGPCK